MAFITTRLKPSLCLLVFAFMLGAGFVGETMQAHAQSATTGASGLPIPRFVSLKSDRVNVRKGPSRDHDVVWTYIHAGLPVEIIQEFENWRHIRDWQGQKGWVFHSLLSSRRTALVTPWDESLKTPVRAKANSSAAIVAELETNVLASINACEDGWCRVHGDAFDGWVDQTRLFGVYPDETLD